MDIKLIAADLDGTLLRNDKTLSPFTLSVLAQCRERGILFFPVTARPPRALERWISGLNYDGALCHNGGVALLNGEIVWEQGVPPETAGQLMRQLRERFSGITLSAEVGGKLYANFDAGQIWANIDYISTDFGEFPQQPAEKLLVGVSGPAQAETVAALLPRELSAQLSEGTLLMIQPRGVEKGRALKALCQQLGISLGETVAFGDDRNDISLLRAAGHGVAVANALPEVKADADEICGSNEEDGPAKWLEKHLLK